MFVGRNVTKTNPLHFVKVIVGFQFHFNRLNGVEKIVDEKTPTSIQSHALNEKNRTFWTGREPM